jgi:hypothetical protein
VVLFFVIAAMNTTTNIAKVSYINTPWQHNYNSRKQGYDQLVIISVDDENDINNTLKTSSIALDQRENNISRAYLCQ